MPRCRAVPSACAMAASRAMAAIRAMSSTGTMSGARAVVASPTAADDEQGRDRQQEQDEEVGGPPHGSDPRQGPASRLTGSSAGHPGAMATEIRHDTWTDGGRYVLLVDGAEVGELDHAEGPAGVRTMLHTGVRPAFEGRGLAAKLVRRALDDARADGVLVVPSCWYVAGYLDRHPDDADLRAPGA